MTIYCDRVPEERRTETTARLFGVDFPLLLEPTVFAMAERLSPDYRGGYWHFYALRWASRHVIRIQPPVVF